VPVARNSVACSPQTWFLTSTVTPTMPDEPAASRLRLRLRLPCWPVLALLAWRSRHRCLLGDCAEELPGVAWLGLGGAAEKVR
jgi:hypothetical protein